MSDNIFNFSHIKLAAVSLTLASSGSVSVLYQIIYLQFMFLFLLFLSGFPLLEPRDLQAESQIKYLARLITVHPHISFQR